MSLVLHPAPQMDQGRGGQEAPLCVSFGGRGRGSKGGHRTHTHTPNDEPEAEDNDEHDQIDQVQKVPQVLEIPLWEGTRGSMDGGGTLSECDTGWVAGMQGHRQGGVKQMGHK